MQIISTKLHGALDYIVGALLAASPWLFDFYRGAAETWIPFSFGCAAIAYSLFTDYELSLVKKIPMPMHLTLDLMSGLFLAISPWICGFASSVWIPHTAIGCLEVAVVLMSKQKFERG